MTRQLKIKLLLDGGDTVHSKTISDVLTSATDNQLDTFCKKVAGLYEADFIQGEKIENSVVSRAE